jgi:hypothetical protein
MNNYHERRQELKKLGDLYEQAGGIDREVIFPLPVILDKLCMAPSSSTYDFIKKLEGQGFLKKVVRVESPSNAGLGDYSSILELPDYIDDYTTDTMLKVTMDNVRVLYSFDNRILQESEK